MTFAATEYLKMTGVFYQKDKLPRDYRQAVRNFTAVKSGETIAANDKGSVITAPYDGEIIMPSADREEDWLKNSFTWRR